MDGFSSHTYMWVNATGERFWVKYHFKTDQGIEFFTQDDADQMAGADADYHRRDLFDAIARGENPKWKLSVVVLLPPWVITRSTNGNTLVWGTC